MIVSAAGRTPRIDGGTVSMPNESEAAAALPAASVAETARKCVPSPVTWVPEVNAAPSSVATTSTG